MASLFFRPLLRPQALGATLGLSLAAAMTLRHRQPIRFDSISPEPYKKPTLGLGHYGQINPKTVREVSTGSILGLCGGLAVSAFSGSLAVLIGLMVIGVQWAASHGLDVIPYDRLQKYFSKINVRSALQAHVAFKFAFGTTFALAAAASF